MIGLITWCLVLFCVFSCEAKRHACKTVGRCAGVIAADFLHQVDEGKKAFDQEHGKGPKP